MDDEPTLEQLMEDVEPNAHVFVNARAFCDLLSLVCDEYVLIDLVDELSAEERRGVAHWASVAHVAAAQDDPPLGRPREPEALSKVLLRPGRVVVLAGLGQGTVKGYEWVSGSGPVKRPRVLLDDGGVAHPRIEEIIGVD